MEVPPLGVQDVAGRERDDERAPWCSNFLVMSEAGKPIYARHGNDAEISRVCGLIQALRSSLSSTGRIQSLQSNRLSLVFMSVKSLTLVAISRNETDHDAYLKLQLEYIFCQILLNFTARVQDYFQFDPGFDLRNMLSSNDSSLLDHIVDNSSPSGNPGPYLLGATETVYPLSPALRDRASNILYSVGLKTEFTAFSILAAGEKLVTMIQPAFPAHQMRMSDLRLLLKVASQQPGLQTCELWTPICLPRFSSQEFLFCYTQCFDPISKLCLIMISQQSSTTQFQLFREAAAIVRRSLDLPAPYSDTVLEILDSKPNLNGNTPIDTNGRSTTKQSSRKDVQWRRNPDQDHDYVDVADELDPIIVPFLPNLTRGDNSLLREIQSACEPDNLMGLMNHYLTIGGPALHFMFRMDAHLQAGIRQRNAGKLTQCISSQVGFPFVDDESKRQLWTTYQKLSLRLRLGSAASGSFCIDAFRTSSDDQTSSTGTNILEAGTHCPAICLTDSSVQSVGGISYVVNECELFIAMGGPDYEFYAVMPACTSFKEAAGYASRLVRRLLADQRTIFLANPLTWNG